METFNKLSELLLLNRSYRRFDASKEISEETLKQLVNLTRYCASGRNAQPLKYRIVIDKDECDAIFQTLWWAGYLEDWDGPIPEERPTAYIVQCLDTHFGPNCLCCDGIHLEAITLGATALGMGGCIIKSFKTQKLSESLNLPKNMVPRYVLALGYPVEEIELVDMNGEPDADFKYYRDENQKHYVPKRPLSELLIK